MRKWVDLDFEIGQQVYLKTDRDQQKRIVTAISLRPSGIMYALSCGSTESYHYDFEISENVDVLIKTSDNS